MSKSQAIERFDSHDWGAELTWLQALKVGSREWCHPAMGLVDPSGRILHLCLQSDALMMVHYHFPAPKGLGKWLGSRDTRTATDAPLSIASELIGAFYRRRHDEFLARMRSLSG